MGDIVVLIRYNTKFPNVFERTVSYFRPVFGPLMRRSPRSEFSLLFTKRVIVCRGVYYRK
jgi:hypothetical protein